MKITTAAGFAVVLLATSIACNDPTSPRGFSLPDGDAGAGSATFVELRCTTCHQVVDENFPRPDNPEVSVMLGGEVSRVKTYGELVTSIINPSHKLAGGYPESAIAVDGQSRMRVYNDVMTVQELINLVAFLQAHYELPEYTPSDYPMYP